MTRLFPPDADCVTRIHAQLEHLSTIPSILPAVEGVGRLTREAISRLVETAFWASLECNEGRNTRLNLAVASPEYAAVRFVSPVAYKTSEIVRLAPAVPSDHCLGAVQVNDEFRIWGFAHRVAISARDTITVRTTEPGTVRVDVGPFRPFAVLDGRSNEIIAATGTDLAHFLQRKLEKAFPADDIPETQAIWRECLALADLVRMILDDGHGGAVLIVPNGNEEWLKSLSSFPYRFEVADTRVRDVIRSELAETDAQGKLLVELLQSGLPNKLKDRISSQFSRSAWGGARAAMQAVAPLAAVDGAIVMTRDLKLLGFGAKIQFRLGCEVSVNRFQAKPGQQAVTPSRLEDLGGMRHQSAACFVEQNKDSFAIIVSQDRHVSVINWDNTLGSVVVVRNAEWWI